MRLRSGLAGLMVLLFAAGARAQDGRISGVVTDANGGMPMPNVQIVVVGTRLATATRADGTTIAFKTLSRIDTPQEVLYYLHGGILPYVLRQLLAAK